MMKGIITACMVVVFGFMTSPATATVYPNERPLNDPMINALIFDAHQFHNQNPSIIGTHCSPENTIVNVADDIFALDGDVMRRAEAVGTRVTDPRHPCRIVFNALTLVRDQTWMKVKRRKAWNTFDKVYHLPYPRWYAARLCRVVYHEVGHNEGLEHTETGLMKSGSSVLPDECIKWARKMVPRPRRVK